MLLVSCWIGAAGLLWFVAIDDEAMLALLILLAAITILLRSSAQLAYKLIRHPLARNEVPKLQCVLQPQQQLQVLSLARAQIGLQHVAKMLYGECDFKSTLINKCLWLSVLDVVVVIVVFVCVACFLLYPNQ